MRAVVQRVAGASVTVDNAVSGAIDRGLCALVCAMEGDTEADAKFIAGKLATLRIFPDDAGRMNLDVRAVGGAVLLISQFTLAADTASGTRPSFSAAMGPDAAEALVARLAEMLREADIEVAAGVFGAHMRVELINDGPVTILLDSRNKRR
jgi:D-tyrosyl-tRNA(Tyr) deacylase